MRLTGKVMAAAQVIAIDGPAGSGKSTIGKVLAEQLSYLYFDTGILYRAVTAEALRREIDPHEQATVEQLSREITIDVQPPSVDDGRQNTVLVGDHDLTWALRTPPIDAHVSIVAAYPGVRMALTGQMRAIGQRGAVVMVGRDIGTVVMPDADVKIYLDASVEARAQRRYEERRDRDDDERSYQAILAGMRQRDLIDSQRDVAPLRPAEDAHYFDSTDMSPDEVLAAVRQLTG